METQLIIKLIIAIILGYAVLFFGMWVFGRDKTKKKEDKK